MGCYVMKYSLCAALLVWSLCGTAFADNGDDRILAARDAASRSDVQRLSVLAASPTDHVLEPYVQYWLLSARIARLSDPAPSEAISEFLRRNAGSVLAEKLRSEWIKRLAYEKRWPQFDAEYGLLVQPDQEAQCWAAQSGGRFAAETSRTLENIWLSLMDTPAACDLPLGALVTRGRMSTEEVWQRFRRLVEAKRFAAAKDAIDWLPDAQTPGQSALNAALENPTRFLMSPAAHAPGGRGGRELVLAALARLARSDVRDAAAKWRSFDGPSYRDEERAYMWGQLAWMAAIAQMPEAASWFTQADGTLMCAEQRAWRVRVALRAADWANVRAAIEAMPLEQREQADWIYWLARAHQAQGHNAEAQTLFLRIADNQPTFYGILASEALGHAFVWPKTANPVSAQELARAQATPDLQRTLALYRLDLRTEALREWSWALRDADDRSLIAAAELARRNGLYDRAINAAERTRSEHDFNLRYLAPYYETFASQAQLQGLDLAWVYGLTRQESRFHPVARSGMGAQGLMQVMPATGRWIAKKTGQKDYDPSWLTRIDTNVQIGSAYLHHILGLLSNNIVMASAGYNAGPGRARRWRDVKPLEGAIYAETIPISETRDYVKRVMANAEMYAALFDRRPTSLLTRLGRIPASGSDAGLPADEP
jgi:soluble lytic murein transglycosylase